ncbi:hypothetical protein Goshw_007653 [Gossypium schwendimanii]|uniref:Uncharacterized protein n=1 Tax=Gossypium schwendimanii TaxID=34291 RepID=A0A7J9M3H9_GOSSC|nr:hypothetical protein [Gossypium schwendimanii]
MEAAVRAHPLWGGCSEEDLHSAGEVSHRYLHMSWDLGLHYLLLLFLSNLDIKSTFQNETSWLVSGWIFVSGDFLFAICIKIKDIAASIFSHKATDLFYALLNIL